MSHHRPHTNELNKEIRSVQGEALSYTSPLLASLVLMEVKLTAAQTPHSSILNFNLDPIGKYLQEGVE